MPDYSSNPSDADLQAMLTSAGLWDDAYSAILPGYAAAAVERFEEATGRAPFLATSPTTVLFDAPTFDTQYPRTPQGGTRMDLDTPFVAVTAVTIDVSPGNPAGRALAIGTDVFLRPARREIKGKPVEWLEFVCGAGCGRDSVKVAGTPGSVTAWPADVWSAVLAGAAAAFAADVVSGALSGGLVSWKESDAAETYDADGALSGNVAMWSARFAQAVSRNVLIGAG